MKDVDLSIEQGEAVGIIGYNGAGKSTLMKLLTGITLPTQGRVEVYGKILLLGAAGLGMHPELTGRENIYVNGAIMGEQLGQLRKKFDEIVAFADLDQFIDTPLKFYSTGMVSRLAFAVVAHLTTDILVLDEVLLAGDYKFQMKCVDKIRELAQSDGRTVVLCSHAHTHVSKVCKRCLFMERGRLVLDGPIDEVLEFYESGTGPLESVAQENRRLYGLSTANLHPNPNAKAEEPAEGDLRIEVDFPENDQDIMQLLNVTVADLTGKPTAFFHGWDEIFLKFRYKVSEIVRGGRIQIALLASTGVVPLVASDHDTNGDLFDLRSPGMYQSEIVIPARWLAPGKYVLQMALTNHYDQDQSVFHTTVSFQVLDSDLALTAFETNGHRVSLKPLMRWATTQMD